ncbi:MAG: hypothetical protein HN742_39270 [Lentisphaerae bacterium]|jgi:hypothetical protein|nr:hypothetical protein [Lentisphaerota bacterium]MBT4822588.1 hypothetical protein [Lentisphaerota bacterium]MBT5611960.1 hypothetical protein [Lentisphaerota bacterium]MBT7057112.1 hypothetical protein [Lentisphaerota bacterium]MBT7847974.1 hypothetical protein [Lentisphaerota bacterium]
MKTVYHPLTTVLLGALCACVDGAEPEHTAAYGVRWKLVVDEVADYLAPCERLGLARGLDAHDFDDVFPYRAMKRCNVLEREGASALVTYEGESGFSLDGRNGNVFVEIPKHYVRRYRADGYEYRYVSAGQLPGFVVDPAFVEDGRELDRIYVSAYEACIRDGKMWSISDVYPTTDCTRPQYRAYARANGIGYGILDLRTLNMLQNLFLVEYAERDSQGALGRGWGKIHQPAKGMLRCTLAETGVNRIVVSDWRATLIQRFFIGSAIQMVDYETHRVLVTGRTIVRVDLDTPGPGRTAVYFDGAPLDTTTGMVLGGAAQKTGWANALTVPSGHTANNGGGRDASYRNAVRYRHIENLWGNVWHFIDGLNLRDGVSYACSSMRNYESGVTTGSYVQVARKQAIQTDNGTVGGDRERHYMKNLVFDPRLPGLALPEDYVNQGEASVPHAQTSSRLGSDTLRHHNFGDYYYLSRKATCYVHGGGFDHYWRCGLFTMRGWATDTARWYLYGARMIHKPL